MPRGVNQKRICDGSAMAIIIIVAANAVARQPVDSRARQASCSNDIGTGTSSSLGQTYDKLVTEVWTKSMSPSAFAPGEPMPFKKRSSSQRLLT